MKIITLLLASLISFTVNAETGKTVRNYLDESYGIVSTTQSKNDDNILIFLFSPNRGVGIMCKVSPKGETINCVQLK